MASEDAASMQDFLERSFQSLASRHMDLKQREVDTAAAKVDELSKQLQSLWTDNPKPAATLAKAKERYSLGGSGVPSQDVLVPPRKSASWETAESNFAPYAFGEAPFYGSAANKSPLGRPVSPRPSFFLQPDLERGPLPPAPSSASSSLRPKVMPIPYEPAAIASSSSSLSPRPLRPGGPSERQYDYKPFAGPSAGREGSPRMPAEGAPQAATFFFPDRVPSPRPPLPPAYENHALYPSAQGGFAPFRAQDDLVLRRRGAAKGWNESDLDVAYEKKPAHSVGYDRGDAHLGLRQSGSGLSLAPWRESSLDGSIGQSKEGPFGTHSATLPRNYKAFPSATASERRPEASFRRSLPANPTGTLPRNWQPASRIPMPPPGPQGGLPKRHKPLPLSMIFRLQNAFWEYGTAGKKFPPAPGPPFLLRSLQKQVLPQPFAQPGQHSPRMTLPASEGNRPDPVRLGPVAWSGGADPPDPELEGLLLLPPGAEAEAVATEDLARPLSPTRLQPVLPPEAQKVPEFEEVARVLADMPRPLKRRGSMEQSPGPALPPTHKRQYQQIISRLFHHQQPPQTRKEEPAGPGVPTAEGSPQAELAPISEVAEQKATAAAAVGSPAPAAPAVAPPSPLPLPPPPPPPAPESPVALTPLPSPEKRSVLRKLSSPRKRLLKKARLNPLVLLLDAALTGELDVVKEAVKELNDPSQPNDEGITALHNAICGANYNIVDFLINIGANVNSPDSHGWTPLHCAASCNDTAICIALVKHGAAIFATTFSDGSMAIEKCDPYREGYSECFSYLADVEQNMGLMNNGAVYALWDYSAEFKDELCFREGEPVTVLRRDGTEEADWWWASLYGQEGYVPKNYFGLFPRVRPQPRMA